MRKTLNSKYEIRSTKQIQSSNYQMSKTVLVILISVIWICFGFRYSNFGFKELKMELVFKRPECLIDVPFHFCPGCHHGIAHRLVAEAIDHFKIREMTIGGASVGCSFFLYDYFNIDVLEAPHGRASAVASGVKRARKDRIVFTYQGDGDLAAI